MQQPQTNQGLQGKQTEYPSQGREEAGLQYKYIFTVTHDAWLQNVIVKVMILKGLLFQLPGQVCLYHH